MRSQTTTTGDATKQDIIGKYAAVNGLKLYYEISGTGTPLVLIHGGGSTIQSTFGRVLSLFAAHIHSLCMTVILLIRLR